MLSEANWLLVTTRKRSLGQGNVFTPVCQLFCSWGGVLGCHFLSWKAPPSLDSPPSPIAPPPGQEPLSGQQAGGMHPTEMLSCYIHLARGIDLFRKFIKFIFSRILFSIQESGNQAGYFFQNVEIFVQLDELNKLERIAHALDRIQLQPQTNKQTQKTF